MRSIVFSCFLIVIFGVSAFGQKANNGDSGLPNDIADWTGQDADKILENPIIKMRLKKLLGEKEYESFSEYFETSTPIEKTGDLLFASGCMIHACTRLESAIAIDTVKNTIHAAIFNEIEETKYFNEKDSEAPEAIVAWAKRLADLKSENQPEAMLIDSFTYGNREEMMLRIDNYVVMLQNDPTSQAYLMINGKKPARAKAEKDLRAYIKLRGMDITRLVFVNRDGKTPAEVELWLVPAGAEPPASVSV